MAHSGIGTPLADVLRGLEQLGYSPALLVENYRFPDWFSPQVEERHVDAAAFGQTPISYDSALIGVVRTNGTKGLELVNRCRALGAPIILEIAGAHINEWAVSRNANEHSLVATFPSNRANDLFAERGASWRPVELLRAKNIGTFQWAPQLGLFTGLLPELEEHVQEKLDPLLRDALWATKKKYIETTGREPNPSRLFTLVFWLLAAKVFRDRQVEGFADLPTDPDSLLSAVAKQYGKEQVPLLLNGEARSAAVERIWGTCDFRNLSVEVLAQIWSTTLVDGTTRKQLGIHRTPRTVVRYLIERIPFSHIGDDKRIILEPCCGSGVFLIGAMHALRPRLFGMTAAERHAYFVNHLVGIETDQFSVEISRLALTLADFPHPGDWTIRHADVFSPASMATDLRHAGIVLCNPPFQDFTPSDRGRYDLTSTKKPAELLNRVLVDLHPSGVIGFVLPRLFLDGRGYKDIRRRLSERFASLELTILPDGIFTNADPEVVLLVATDPRVHSSVIVSNRRVSDSADARIRFRINHDVSSEHVVETTPVEASSSLGVPELADVWDWLINYPSLTEFAELHRGIEWNQRLTKKGFETGTRFDLVRKEPGEGFRRGVPPKAKFNVFEQPSTCFLSLRADLQRGNAYTHPWERPKAIVNKATKSRGHWRMAAFPDAEGLVVYQTFIAAWPKTDRYDEVILSAILNSPLANAFVATREGKIDVTIETLKLLPVPNFTDNQLSLLRVLVAFYRRALSSFMQPTGQDAEGILKQIDAVVMSGYRLPPRLERQVLDWFNGHPRPTSHPFQNYFPADFDMFFSLSDYLSPQFSSTTGVALLERAGGSERGE